MAKEILEIEDDMIVASGFEETPEDQEEVIDKDKASEDDKKAEEEAAVAEAARVAEEEAKAKGDNKALDAKEVVKVLDEGSVKDAQDLKFDSDDQKWVYKMLSEGKDDEVLQALNKKHGYKTMTTEQKAISYLKTLHPSLDDDDLAFKAENEFGIGVEAPDEYASDAEKNGFKAMEIKRKELLHDADGYFTSEAEAFKLPTLPSIEDGDPEYKSYKEFIASQEENEILIKAQEDKLIDMIDTSSAKVETIEIKPTIQLDDREFSFVSEFKLDDNKRKELAEFAKVYTPTQEEQAEFFPEDGKFNMEGYLGRLAQYKFRDQIINAAVKEGIARAREEFVEKDLKNSTLRNNETQQQSTHDIDPYISAMEA